MMSAVKGGRPFVTNVMSFPTEIYWAMDIAGIEYDFIAGMFSLYMGNKDEIFTAAKSIGIRPEICSAQRAPIGWFAKGWYPKPTAIVNTSLCQCDNCAQNANIMGALYDVPVFCITRPYLFWTQKGLDFMVEEIKDAIEFLEKTTGHKMNYDKLSEATRLTKKQMEISVEIHNLIKTARPCPVKSGTGFLIHSKPLEALARIFYVEPYHGFYGPYEVFGDMIINDAIQSGADGAVNFFNTNCRMCGAVSRLILEQFFLVLDNAKRKVT
uniref:Uncharacterized protein n=1 Tax=uncultured Desulfobacterium sp. TaxID=201089 RepID=E1YA32_9BACT|nr:hypothetical protein N47_H22480 [uncultured Desulfobacterium sp.]